MLPRADAAVDLRGQGQGDMAVPPPDAPVPPRDSAAPPGDGGYFGASRCDPSFLACEDFESGAFDRAIWTAAIDTGSTLEVTMMRAARGQYGLHVRSAMAGSNSTSLKIGKIFPAMNNGFFARAFVYVAAPLPKYNFNIFWPTGRLASGGQSLWGLGGSSVPFGDAGGIRYIRWVYHPGDIPDRSSTRADTDRWVCWEFQMIGATDEAHVWIDEKPLPDIDVKPTAGWTSPTFSALNVGFHHAHPEDAATDLWIDSIAIANDRIGCRR